MLRKISIRLVEAEERSQHIRKLVSKGLGFKEEEEFMNREKSKLKGGKVFDEKRKIIKLAMDEKWSDNFKLIYKLKKQRNRLRTRICGAYETKSRVLEGILKKIGNQAKLARQEARTRLKKKEQFLTKKYGGNTRLEGGIEELAKVDQSRFGAARIFDTDGKWEKEPSKEPAVVCDEGQELVLSKDEINLLKLGPKFCVLGHLSEENFEGELEQCILKYKWDVMGEEKGKQRQSLSDIAIDCVIGEEGKQESEEYASLLEAKCRMIFDHETATLDFGNRRATDVKNNARVIFPRTQDFQKEANLQMLRIEAMGVFRDYVKGNCDTRGRQKSNLSTSEQRGLKSLKKRVEEGQIVVMTTDKTGSFAVLGRERYLEAGLSHAQGDTEVGWGEIQTAQREVNGHISMLIKIFKIGKNWTHEGRIRETMIGESMETCPVHLLYKDHKGWDPAKGGVPPTRQVAGGNRGVNLYLSEVVSDILEPLVGMVEGGREVISMEDLAARIEDMNTAQEGWTSSSWWEGMVYGDLIACGKCNGSQDYIWQDGQPDRCRCPRNTGQEDTVLGKTRVTWEYMKTLRRLDWEKENEWEDGDRDRVLDSTEALPEDVQDYSTPMVVIGSDVVNMYPSLDVDAVADMIAEEVQQIPIKWSNIDYLECARYLALNWTESQCRASPLRRVLPWRRGRRGTRPGITGTGPMGRERGDQEQWVFPTVKLTEEEKGLLIGNVVRIAIKAMFSRHYYSFGGKMFSQRRGGPIGLRGTCAVARFIMQIFDGKWEAVLRNVGLTFNLIARYMDDGRVFMPPLRPGWRWVNRRLQYTVRWEGEDYGLSPQERTKRAIGLSMNEIMTFLRFTTESGEEFKEGWLPTLDSNLMVDSTNTVLFRFWEKPTNSNKVVQFRTAMGENMKQQILTADMMRRMVNTSEECTDEDYCTIVDSYAQKIVNSGYGEEQARKIITAGIKGWRTKTDRCKKEGRRVRRTAQDSLGQRVKNKLLGKSSWFRKPGGAGRNKLTRRGGGLKGGSTSKDTEYPVRTVLFVEQTPRGELAAKMRELVSRLEPLLGFKIKIAERCGKTLQSQFPLNNLWGGTKCGREDCTTCEQDGAEELPDCTRRSVLYENACLNCLPSAGSKGGPKEGEGDPDTPAIYVGETSRSIMERSREHWASYRGGKEESHILKHQHVAHGGENDPRFIMRVVSQHRTALARQVSEAVRIGRRGGAGAVLNSKAEFNRCHIPRLRLEDEEERKQREQQMEQEDKLMEEERDREQEQWVTQRLRQRDKERREFGMRSSRKGRSEPRSSNSNSKRRGSTGSREEAPTKKRKKNRKYDLLEENWGAMDTIVEEPGEEGSLTRGVQEQQHTLPTDELTETVREEGLMVLEKEISNPAEQLNDIAEEVKYENGRKNHTSLMSEEALSAPAGNLRCTCKVEMKNVDKWEDFWDTEEGQDTSFWTKPLEKQIRKIRASQVRTIRRQEWERRVEYDVDDEDRSWNSKDVLEEDLQNFEVPQVIIGADVEALYPSLDTEECARIVKAETLRSKIRWNDLDYLEGARFIALNRTADWCRQSDLRRVLPVRRGKTGSRPGVRGKGPMGRGRGDQEQWMFPNITLTEEEKRKITAEVWRIVTEVMFKNHLYTFGGRTYRQRSGGPIGLRGTCAIARLIMCSWDRDWTTMMEERRVKLWRYMRYMDDARVFMPPIRRGWRWVGGELIFKKTWEKEDFREGTGELEVTRRVMHSSMQEVFHFLKFTTEVGEGEGGWLPTLDLKIRVEDSNQVSFSYYEKPTTTNVMVQRRSAMEENSKMQILSNDMVRRLANTDPRQDKVEHCRVVDMFTQKLLTSGYSQEQARKIILSGIRGWERKKIRAKNEGRGVYRTSRQSAAGRTRKKVLGKTTWFRKRKTDNKEEIGEVKKTGRKRTKKEIQKTQEERSLRTRTVLFVENTKEGGLARKLREVVEKIQYILGYRIKVVERSGTPLKLLFPLGGLGEEDRCGREDCLPCGQEGQEGRTRCRKRCILYENICMICNPDILDKKAKINPPKDHPSVYVGESARSAKERTEEHWRGFKDKREDSHIFKHHILHHHGEGKPSFHMRVSGVFKSALTRQVAEAVRIRRWGEGVVLNSKSEFNRCQLGRLTLGEEKSSNSTIIKDTPPNTNYNPILTDQREEESDREIEEWKKKKTADRRMMEIKDNIDLGRGLPMSPSTKRIRVDNLESDGKKGRKLKYPVISKDWGEQSEGAEDRNKDDKGNKDDCKEQRPQRRSRTGTRNGVERSVDPTESVHHPCEVENEGHLPCNQEETPSPTLLEKEGEVTRSTVLDSGSPSRGQSCNMIHQLHSNKKQTTIECFLDSVKEKMTQPKELEITTRTPVRKVVKVPIVKESGRKRKKTSLPAPSIGSIKNYFTTGVKKTRNDDVVIGGGVSTNDTDTPTNDVVNTDVVLDGVRKTSLAPLNEQPAVNNDVKKTFTTIMRGGSSVKDTIKKHEALLENCVFGNGRCMTHYVKLERTVKQKKYSVINSIGKIDWKYRDVTCLVCPSQKGRGFVNLGNDKLPGAVGNMKGKTAD